MKLTFLITALFATVLNAVSQNKVTVIGSDDRMPVAGASVISSQGIILGFTDGNGQITVKNEEWPVSFRSLGYDTRTIDVKCDTVLMSPSSYSLSEVTVSPADRPITRIVTFAREYCTGATDDTLQLYNEYMLEYFITDGKVKGYDKGDAKAKVRNANRYGRIAQKGEPDSIMRPGANDDITLLSFLELMAYLPHNNTHASNAIKEGAPYDTIPGEYSNRVFFRQTENNLTVDTDLLANYKDHHWEPWIFKMFGLTMDMTDFRSSMLFKRNPEGIYSIYDYLYGSSRFHVVGKGKMLKRLLRAKKPIDIFCFIEQYPIEIEHLTVGEYKEMKKERRNSVIDFRLPEQMEPLPEGVTSLIERINRELK